MSHHAVAGPQRASRVVLQRAVQTAARPSQVVALTLYPMPRALQPKLDIGPVDDPLEHEADRVADQVMRMPDPKLCAGAAPMQIARKCTASENEDEKQLQMKPVSRAAPTVTEAPPSVHQLLRASSQPLESSTRAFMESRFGQDFPRVRVHTDESASRSAEAVAARAYTVGPHIAFRTGEYTPATTAGRQLLAHELAHVVQQGGTGPATLRRVHADPAGRKQFDCADYSGDLKLEACLNDEDRLRPGDRSEAVAKVQRGLLADGADLGPTGADGSYGPRTAQAVMAFKRKYQLGFEKYADVGPGTMAQLDTLGTSPRPTPPGPTPPGPTPPGPTADEPQRADPSASKVPPATPDELDVDNASKTKPDYSAVVDLVINLSKKPPHVAASLRVLKGLDIPTLYATIHRLHDGHAPEFAVLKSRVTAASPLELRIKVICDAAKNDQDMAVLDWELFATVTQLAELPKADREAILLAYDSRYPTLQMVKASPGFQMMTTTEQMRFLVYVGGANLISRRAGLHLVTEIVDPKFDRTKPQMFRNYLKAESSVKQLDDKTGLNPFAQRPVSSTPPADAGLRSFRSKPGKTPAETVSVTLGAAADPDKVTIPVFRPKAAALKPELNYQTFTEAAQGLSAVPAPNAKRVKRIDIEPAFNPEDPHWASVYHTPGFHSYMTAGADGIINIYPTGTPVGAVWMMGSFVHETGHIISDQAFGPNPQGPKWKPWRDAMNSDGLHPSDYAKKSPSEDFAEMVELARMVKGTMRETEIRTLFPARMKILDAMNLT
ncbi:MAG: hypothetical protein QOE48_5741 [Mycobacterium sp.]|jgi:hypothetical protein|nr:hypothetical protein [Mycobacterium sp.]MDT5131955.1 hypothetical protein [Mycobacterium sp.]MDT5277978.1 hypothetical protein [Mycobacterium sp.]MDT5310035.1 hypothetical protein [Mycobacterium sp.]